MNIKITTPFVISEYKGSKNKNKRRIITSKECEIDLKNYLESIFGAVVRGIDKYNEIRLLFSPQSKTRGFDAGALNTAIVESLQKTFPDNWYWGMYKRFILRLSNYLFLVKKLDRNGMPMNIKTSHNDNISNQTMRSLFNDGSASAEPIVYIGYQASKTGEVLNPRLVYIDEGNKKWELFQQDITQVNKVSIYSMDTTDKKTSLVSFKNDLKTEKKIINE